MVDPQGTSGHHAGAIGALGDPIARGRTADVYLWKPGTVLKLFHGWVGRADIEREARITRAVHAATLPVPCVGDIVELEGRIGLDYGRVEGRSMWAEMAARPWRLIALAHQLAAIHAHIHTFAGPPDVPAQRDRLRQKIARAADLELCLLEATLDALAALPDSDRLCHGDFHPGNVLLADRGPIIIDWIDATVGNPLADVARTTVLLGGVIATGPPPFERAALAWMHRCYLRRYFAQHAGARPEYQRWLPIVAAARMEEGITELKAWLHAQVETAFAKPRK